MLYITLLKAVTLAAQIAMAHGAMDLNDHKSKNHYELEVRFNGGEFQPIVKCKSSQDCWNIGRNLINRKGWFSEKKFEGLTSMCFDIVDENTAKSIIRIGSDCPN